MDIENRFQHAIVMAEHYKDFRTFAEDGMVYLGFSLTDVQGDISEYMESGPRLRMVMAQRGEAKSTLAALYAVWRIMQKPSTRVLIVSGGETQASEVATLVVRLITTWDIFEYLRPDRSAGDRTSITDGFDIHYALRGIIDKSPTVRCMGITAQLQGARADLLIPDDIETTKNGLTMTQRAHLLQLSREFTSICADGHILYLGTPQTKDSIYNTLPGRGFAIRIWPGRYPTNEELEKYGERLAPLIGDRLRADPTLQTGGGLDGKRGKPTDPQRYNEAALVEKELDQGPEGFQLQYMLDTSLADAARQQLKLSDLLVANFDWQAVPEILPYRADPSLVVPLAATFPVPQTRMYFAPATSCRYTALEDLVMHVDPAGGGADEIGYYASGAIGPYIHILCGGGLKGGLGVLVGGKNVNAQKMLYRMKEYGIKTMICESNMGAGLFELNMRGEVAKLKNGDPDTGTEPDPYFKDVEIRGEWSKGQKERRIIDSCVSAMQRHRVVIHQQVFTDDEACNQQHSLDKRAMYSLFSQIQNVTTDRDSLPHDDRVEAFSMAVRYHRHRLVADEAEASKTRTEAQQREWMANPMGYADEANKRPQRGARGDVQRRRGRR